MKHSSESINLANVSPLAKRVKEPPWIRLATGAYRGLPDFIIIGAQRCGTTTLYRLLSQHPAVFPAWRKEPDFFGRAYHRGLRWYRSYFPLKVLKFWRTRVRAGHLVTGEATVHYLFHPHAPARIARTLPGVKLIALLRNPVDRAYSHYQFKVERGAERLSFESAIDAEAERLAGERERLVVDETYDSLPYRHFSYLARGIYVDQLASWAKFFSPEQLLILKSEEAYTDPRSTVQGVFSYLGLSSSEVMEYRSYNVGHYPPMTPEMRRRLTEYFAPHNRRLAELLGREFGW